MWPSSSRQQCEGRSSGGEIRAEGATEHILSKRDLPGLSRKPVRSATLIGEETRDKIGLEGARGVTRGGQFVDGITGKVSTPRLG